MTIELITGTPGSGKTCYAVSQRLKVEVGRKVVVEDSLGQPYEVERRIVESGIRSLVLPHERLPHPLTGEKVTVHDLEKWNAVDNEGEPVHKRLPFTEPQEVEASVYNWWLWCRPGDLIVVDECQLVISRGTLNKKAAPYLHLLAMHRHYGVDFLVITQHPDFLDPFMRKLVGMHRHVRSIMGFPLCMVYEWDHASNPERYSMATKAKYLRRPSHYKLYKSAAAHVKPPTTGRGIFVTLALLAVGGLAIGYSYNSRHAAAQPVAAAQAAPAVARAASAPPAVFTLPPRPAGWVDVPKLSGCYSHAGGCGCIDEWGRSVAVQKAMCETSAAGFSGLVQWEPNRSKRYEPDRASFPQSSASSAPLSLAGARPF